MEDWLRRVLFLSKDQFKHVIVSKKRYKLWHKLPHSRDICFSFIINTCQMRLFSVRIPSQFKTITKKILVYFTYYFQVCFKNELLNNINLTDFILYNIILVKDRQTWKYNTYLLFYKYYDPMKSNEYSKFIIESKFVTQFQFLIKDLV